MRREGKLGRYRYRKDATAQSWSFPSFPARCIAAVVAPRLGIVRGPRRRLRDEAAVSRVGWDDNTAARRWQLGKARERSVRSFVSPGCPARPCVHVCVQHRTPVINRYSPQHYPYGTASWRWWFPDTGHIQSGIYSLGRPSGENNGGTDVSSSLLPPRDGMPNLLTSPPWWPGKGPPPCRGASRLRGLLPSRNSRNGHMSMHIRRW